MAFRRLRASRGRLRRDKPIWDGVDLLRSKGVRRAFAIFGSAIFFVLAPGTIAGLVPWWISRWRFSDRGIVWIPLRMAGCILLAGGLLALLDSFVRFAVEGFGTPAPIFPTRQLVVTGLYRYVRNPMYLAVVAAITGQGLIFENTRVLAYGAFVLFTFHLFVIGYEEPTLKAAFGQEYERFCGGVSRWIPRLSARR